MTLRSRVRFPAAVLAVVAAGVFQLLIPRFPGQAIDQAARLLKGAQVAGGAARWRRDTTPGRTNASS